MHPKATETQNMFLPQLLYNSKNKLHVTKYISFKYQKKAHN